LGSIKNPSLIGAGAAGQNLAAFFDAFFDVADRAFKRALIYDRCDVCVTFGRLADLQRFVRATTFSIN
jgi:hypothetical protein